MSDDIFAENPVAVEVRKLLTVDRPYCFTCKMQVTHTTLTGTRQRCDICKKVLFESEIRLNAVLNDKEVDSDVKKYIRKLLRQEWPKCGYCGRKFRNLSRHIAKKHPRIVEASCLA